MEQENNKNNDNSNKLLVVIIVILTVALVGTIGYITYDKIVLNDKGTTEEKEESKKDENVVEKKVEDSTLIADIERKIETLTSIDETSDDGAYNHFYIYKNGIKSNELSTDRKLYSVLEKNYDENRYSSPVTTNYDFSSFAGAEHAESYKQFFTQLDVSKIEEDYYNVYGEKVSSHKDFEACPTFLYDSQNSKYYGGKECGDPWGIAIRTYTNKMVSKGNNIHAFVNIAMIILDTNSGANNIYTDYDRTNLYSDTVTDFNNVINESNYTQFSEYKFTFTKDKTGNYYFTSVEKS